MLAVNAPGWYGKLPSLGDFASRRLPPEFIEAWDDWLAGGLAEWRAREPTAWLADYLAGPSWRFMLSPGLLAADDFAWVGVLMPSVDSVGRYFPLTLVQPLRDLPVSTLQARALLEWLQRLDDLAADAIQDDWQVDHLERALERLGPFHQQTDQPHALADPLNTGLFEGAPIELAAGADVAAFLAGAARDQFMHGLRGKALWLRNNDRGQPVLRTTAGLPRGRDFSALLKPDKNSAPLSTGEDHA